MFHNCFGSLLCTALLFQDIVALNTVASLGTATGIGSSRSILPQPLNATEDSEKHNKSMASEKLNKAMAGFGTDEKVFLLHSSSDHY
jgi:hypothetical protein